MPTTHDRVTRPTYVGQGTPDKRTAGWSARGPVRVESSVAWKVLSGVVALLSEGHDFDKMHSTGRAGFPLLTPAVGVLMVAESCDWRFTSCRWTLPSLL